MASTEKSVADRKMEEKQSELIMERLRSKASHLKPWAESIKSYRLALLDKRYTIDSAERLQMQKCLDTLQKSIKVTSLQAMVERLECITRQLRKRNFDDCSLKFTAGPNGTDCFISSDMFYVEVLLELNGSVKDVKIAHHGDPLSCPELTQVLRAGDFAEFTRHLEGLASIYQLNADKKQKSKAYLALQALETDLSMLAQLQSSINEPNNLVHKSPVGILQQRKGGHAMKLTYFISPYDLLDMETKSSIPLTVDTVIERQLGQYVTVCIESSTSHKLQTQSLMSISRTNDGKSLPSFAAPSNLNSTTLPASFVLKLASPMPITTALVKKIQSVTCIECADMTTSQPLLSLITQLASKGEMDCNNNKGLFVVLPDQHHCYFLNGAPDLQGVMVSSIPFTHPTHVPQILVFLRQQMLFNVLISSCIRTGSKQDLENALMFEVTALSWLHVSVSFEHPLEESMATAEFDLSDITNVKCKLCTMCSDASICSDEYASKVVQRCLSIPVTMRAVIRKAQGQQKRSNQQNEDVYVTMVMGNGGKFSANPQNPAHSEGTNNQGGNSNAKFSISKLDVLNTNVGSASSTTYNMPSPDIATTPLGLDSQGYNESSPAHGDLFPLSTERGPGIILTGNHFGQGASTQSLSSSSVGGGKTSTSAVTINAGQRQLVTLVSNPIGGHVMGKPRKERSKRKAMSEGNSPRSQTGRSPKRKHSEDDMVKDLTQSDVEAGSSSSMTIPLGMDLELSVAGSQSRAGLESDSRMVKIPTSLENIVKFESLANRNNAEISHLLHRAGSSNSSSGASGGGGGAASLQNMMDKGVNDSSTMDSDFFNSNNQNRNSDGDFTFKSEPIDFETEVLNNQSSSFDDSLIESGDEFNLEQLGINPSVITTKVTTSMANPEKCKDGKRHKKLKLEIPGKIGDKDLGTASEGETKTTPPPVILDIISSQLKLVETTKATSVVDLTEKRPSVEIIPIGNVNTSTTSNTSLLNSGGLKIVNNPLKNSEAKIKHKEIRRSLTMSERSDKKSKGDAKKERKRKSLDNLNSEDKAKLMAVSITALPNSSTTNNSVTMEKAVSIVSKPNEPTLPKSITLSVKSFNPPTSLSTSSASMATKAVTTSCKKPQLPVSTTVSPTKTVSILKAPQQTKAKPSVKSSGLGKPAQMADSKNMSPSGSKVTISPLKVHSKVKSSNLTSGCNVKSSSQASSMSSSSGGEVKLSTKPATMKLKHLNIPSSTTVTPIIKSGPISTPTVTTLQSPTLTSSPVTFTALTTTTGGGASAPSTPTSTTALKLPSISVSPSITLTSTTVMSTTTGDSNNGNGSTTCTESSSNSSSKLSKSAIRSRKGSLSAVIDKLRNSTRQSGGPCGDGQTMPSERKSESKGGGSGGGGGGGGDGGTEKKDASRSEKKESHKEMSSVQKSSDKPKLGSGMEQKLSEKKPEFTVKQSSQGIKLTVTKTRCTEGNTKLSSSIKSSGSKINNSSNKSVSLSTSSVPSSGSRPSQSGSATGLKPGVNSGPASKKLSVTGGNSKNPSTSASGTSNTGNGGQSVTTKSTVASTVVKTSSSTATSFASSVSKPNQISTAKQSQKESKNNSSSGAKTPERTPKTASHETGSRPSTPKLEKSISTTAMSSAGVTTTTMTTTSMPPPPPPPPPVGDTLNQSRKGDDNGSNSSGRQGGSRQSTKHLRDSQSEETEAERQFRLLLAQTKMESNSSGTTTITNSALVAKTSVNSTHSGINTTSICSISERPEGSRTPKQEVEKSPKNSDGRSTPKNSTAEKFFNFNANSASNKSEGKRPSTPKVADSAVKTTENSAVTTPSSVENKIPTSGQSNPVIAKPNKRQTSPANDDVSSPEDSLIIDYPGTPHQKSPEKKAKSLPVEPTTTMQSKSPTSPVIAMVRSPAQPSPGIKSPLVIGTPHSDHSNPSSVARSSPCVIDDDLMDEALMGVGK